MTRGLWVSLCRTCLPIAFALAVTGCEDPEPPDPAALIPDWRVYYNREIGVELRYPYTLSVNSDVSADGQLLLKLQWVGRGTTMFKLETAQAAPGDSPVPAGQADQMVGGERASLATVEVDGEDMQQLKLVRDGRVYFFTGDGDTFEKILDSVEFFEPGSIPPSAVLDGAQPAAR